MKGEIDLHMKFTYNEYENLIKLIKNTGYVITSYKNWQDAKKCVILRHDIDNDIDKALQLARVEKNLGVKSTYFVLVTSDFYNIFSSRNEKLLHGILDCGHDVGLHFDEARYPEIKTHKDASEKILEEAKLLSIITQRSVDTVSMHRPSKMMLEADMKIPGIINSYGQLFFEEFKYVSDSRRRWREPVEEIVTGGLYNRLHILTHAIWYNEEEIDLHSSLFRYINSGNIQRYRFEKENFTDLQSVMSENEVMK